MTTRPSYLKLMPTLVVLACGTAAAAQITNGSERSEPDGASLVIQLLASDGETDDRFGGAVAVSGDTIVIGATDDDDQGNNAGAAYVFVRNGGTWSEQQKLTASDGANFDAFGNAVAIDGDTIVVGAFADDAASGGSGAAYVFVRAAGVWSQQQKLIGEPDVDFFGQSVGVSGDTAVIGSPADFDVDTFAGAAHVFTRSGTTWSQQQKLSASDPAAFDNFGWAVDISGETVLVGAFNDFVVDFGSGSAYAFTRSGSTWSQQQKLSPGDGKRFGYFGRSVSLDGDTALVGADEDIGGGPGAAYVFTRSAGTWSQQQKLTPSDGVDEDQFGRSVSVSGDTALVGSYQFATEGPGAAYVFARSGATWTETDKLTDKNGAKWDFFGFGVGIAGSTLVAGASGDDDSGDGSGSAFVFGLGPGLAITGSCPANLTLEISGATPLAQVAIAYSATPGSFVVPVGGCAGTETGLGAPTLLATVGTDAQGEFSVTTSVPAGACALYLQALDLTTCATTPVAQPPE